MGGFWLVPVQKTIKLIVCWDGLLSSKLLCQEAVLMHTGVFPHFVYQYTGILVSVNRTFRQKSGRIFVKKIAFFRSGPASPEGGP